MPLRLDKCSEHVNTLPENTKLISDLIYSPNVQLSSITHTFSDISSCQSVFRVEREESGILLTRPVIGTWISLFRGSNSA